MATVTKTIDPRAEMQRRGATLTCSSLPSRSKPNRRWWLPGGGCIAQIAVSRSSTPAGGNAQEAGGRAVRRIGHDRPFAVLPDWYLYASARSDRRSGHRSPQFGPEAAEAGFGWLAERPAACASTFA